MRLFHRTNKAAAEQLLANGFRDSSGNYGFGFAKTGTWLSDVPVDSNEGTKGDVLIIVDLAASEAELAEFELIDESGDRIWREWHLPATLINQRGSAWLASEEEENDAEGERFRRAEKVLADLGDEPI